MLCKIIEAQASRSLSVINFGSALRSNESIQSLHEIYSLIFLYSFLNWKEQPHTKVPIIFYGSVPHASNFKLDTGSVNITVTLKFFIFIQLLFIFLELWVIHIHIRQPLWGLFWHLGCFLTNLHCFLCLLRILYWAQNEISNLMVFSNSLYYFSRQRDSRHPCLNYGEFYLCSSFTVLANKVCTVATRLTTNGPTISDIWLSQKCSCFFFYSLS